ncbi:hypothetical protein ACGFW5_09855 [Streptomyces sp. NPDC048416]|uniref:hypothetical protein n=1 Tax=Streptomyces sp. NPDC048416 TaxID=3365546 RepID=UPI003711B839
MNHRIAMTAAVTAALVSLTAGAASAAPVQDTGRAGQSCEGIRLTGELPAPPAGQAVRQQITIGPDCKPEPGPVEHVAATGAAPSAKALLAAPAANAAAGHQVRSWNEMFDCCNIRMTGVYTTSAWSTDGGRVTTAATTATQQWNREPWDAGWSLKSASAKDDCTTDCPVVNSEAHADFTYRGIFDVTGAWYENTHHSSVRLNADATATCTFDVELKHSFVGWNWQRGCE